MTTSADLVDRVRSGINEPAGNDDPQRTDSEIAQWVTDAMYDYISKIPADAVPELVQQATFSGTYWHITSDFIKLLHVNLTHTITVTGATTSKTLIEQCKVLDIDEEYIALYSPPWAGAWAKFGKVGSTKSLCMGPNAVSGTITYIGLPASVASCNVTFPLTMGHEEPIVNYATAMALAKLNDADADRYLERYERRVAAEQGMKYTKRRKVEKQDPQEDV